jgi:hypothetical protein
MPLMSRYQLSLSLWFVVSACGDDLNRNAQPDATEAPDAPQVTPDARVCDLETYPPPVAPITVDLTGKFTLTLDGVGERCDQIVRALTDPDPSLRPPELAMLDAGGVIGTCHFNTDTSTDVVRLRAPLYNGIPLFDPPQDAVIHVDAQNNIVYLHGDYLPAGYVVNEACRSGEELTRSIPGYSMSYRKLLLCQYQGDGAYQVASDDEIVVGEEGYLIDRDRKLRRVRAMDVFLLSDHVDDDIGNSDAFCCMGTLDHCVGQRLFVDALTGEILSQAPHCHSC